VFCLGTSCFNIASVNDPDFARSVSMIEGAREAGIYLDTDRMRMFIGSPSECSLRYGPSGTMVANCCKPDSSYSGYSNQSLFGGSSYMYDSLFTMDNAQFIYQAVGAMVAGGEVTGSFSAFGVTLTMGAESVAALEASYAAGETAGAIYVAESGTWAVSFNPWAIVVMIIIMLIIEEISCDTPEEIHQLRDGARLCHQVGEYCVRRHLFPHHRQCRKLNRAFCCFNSMLSRIINQQGRPQIGKGWGDPRGPDCSGFTVAELQRLDFGAMDFSEFYASIIPKLPDTNAIATGAAAGAASCYYGRGRCK
jgi:conjugal transfer mating pair stabilization protein TraN